MTRKSGQLRIVSDGMGPTTVVMDANDTVIENVGAVTLFIAASEVNHADLTIVGVSVDVKAVVGDVEMICPVCELGQTHTCTPQTLGGN